WRGGLGVETVIELLDDACLTVRGDRLGGHPPPGTRGGEAGRPGSFSVERADGRVEVLAARQTDVQLAAGDRFVLRTSGGGGLGPARERDAARVRDDVVSRKVTPEGAARDYGLDA
ncbi:MAG TPA: hydantoinase B/oxoprolinase family protein, partial [Acidimicrobiia bacterium]|nr:hydantoinase B/oxoprolinase family protein [Acidimicrobiia bacterium]